MTAEKGEMRKQLQPLVIPYSILIPSTFEGNALIKKPRVHSPTPIAPRCHTTLVLIIIIILITTTSHSPSTITMASRRGRTVIIDVPIRIPVRPIRVLRIIAKKRATIVWLVLIIRVGENFIMAPGFGQTMHASLIVHVRIPPIAALRAGRTLNAAVTVVGSYIAVDGTGSAIVVCSC